MRQAQNDLNSFLHSLNMEYIKKGEIKNWYGLEDGLKVAADAIGRGADTSLFYEFNENHKITLWSVYIPMLNKDLLELILLSPNCTKASRDDQTSPVIPNDAIIQVINMVGTYDNTRKKDNILEITKTLLDHNFAVYGEDISGVSWDGVVFVLKTLERFRDNQKDNFFQDLIEIMLPKCNIAMVEAHLNQMKNDGKNKKNTGALYSAQCYIQNRIITKELEDIKDKPSRLKNKI